MNWKSTSFKTWLLSCLYGLALFFATSPLALAAEDEEEAVAEPVWVMSWASFIFFGGATVIICVLFSKRYDSILTQEEQKRVNQMKADRVTKRRNEERLARLHGQQKH